MSKHPYTELPDHAFWRRAIAEVSMHDVDPVVAAPFSFSREDRIATAGSCFAQHISQRLRAGGYNYFVTEPPHPMLAEEDARSFNYGTFSARYGNIYTARQLRQLFDRAYGRFVPLEDVWQQSDGALIDPFRPLVQPGGFSTRQEFEADRAKHFASVRRAFEGLEVLVFTLGLTESWESLVDGSAFPLCPGVAGGQFDPSRHALHNHSVQEVVDDMTAFIGSLRQVNPRAKVILTVSPVPLVATAEPKHVLLSTTYSKCVLRVACEMLAASLEQAAYFPSYEIITGSFSRGAYFAADCRSVTAEGVSHVMRVFLRHFACDGSAPEDEAAPTPHVDRHLQEMDQLAALDCDEQTLDPPSRPSIAPRDPAE